MEQTQVYERTLSKQANRIATLSLDLDLAHAQIEILKDELSMLREENEADKSMKEGEDKREQRI